MDEYLHSDKSGEVNNTLTSNVNLGDNENFQQPVCSSSQLSSHHDYFSTSMLLSTLASRSVSNSETSVTSSLLPLALSSFASSFSSEAVSQTSPALPPRGGYSLFSSLLGGIGSSRVASSVGPDLMPTIPLVPIQVPKAQSFSVNKSKSRTKSLSGSGSSRSGGIQFKKNSKVKRSSGVVRGARRLVHSLSLDDHGIPGMNEESLPEDIIMYSQDDMCIPQCIYQEKWPGHVCALCCLGELSQLGQGDLQQFSLSPDFVLPDKIETDNDDLFLSVTKKFKSSPLKGKSPKKQSSDIAEPYDETSHIGYSDVPEISSLFTDNGNCYAHNMCALWSSFVNASSKDTMLHVDKAVVSGAGQRCAYCKNFGATILCKAESCPTSYHFPCAVIVGCFMDLKNVTMVCPSHSDVATDILTDISCVICENFSPESSLLYCTVCGNHYHGHCLKPPLLVSSVVRAGWQCMDCRLCQMCKRPSDDMVCAVCDKSYHVNCARPFGLSVSKTEWKCKNCRVCGDCGSRTAGSRSSSRWHANFTVCDNCYQLRQKGFACSVCKKAYKASLQKTLAQCSICKKHVHSSCDSEANLSCIQSKWMSDRCYEYICSVCRLNPNVHGDAASEGSQDTVNSLLSEDSNDGLEFSSPTDDPFYSPRSLGYSNSMFSTSPVSGSSSRGIPYGLSNKRGFMGHGFYSRLKGSGNSTGKCGLGKKALSSTAKKKGTVAPSSRKGRGASRSYKSLFNYQQSVMQGLGSCHSQVKEEGEENKLLLISSEDEFSFWQDVCAMCGAFGQDVEGRLVSCAQCGQCYHPYCANVKVNRVILEKGWRCLDCTVCEGCGERNDEGRLVLCEDCDISYHIYCMSPPLSCVPSGIWKCKWCAICQHCGRTDPGHNSTWKQNYSTCGICYSYLECPVCEEPYKEGELIIKCSLCEKWLHSSDDSIHTEEEAERCISKGYQCLLCRPQDALPPHMLPHSPPRISRTSTGTTYCSSYLAHLSPERSNSPIENPKATSKMHYVMDGICLSESGMNQIKNSTLEPLKKSRQPSKSVRPSRGLSVDSCGSRDADEEEDDDDDKLDNEESPRHWVYGMKEGTLLPARDDGSAPNLPEGYYTLAGPDPGTYILRKKRCRNIKNLGIGGFQVRIRGKKEEEKAIEESTLDPQILEQRRKRSSWRTKKKIKLLEKFPSYIQEAFFGRNLMDTSNLDEERKLADSFSDEGSGTDENFGVLNPHKEIKLSKDELQLIQEAQEKQKALHQKDSLEELSEVAFPVNVKEEIDSSGLVSEEFLPCDENADEKKNSITQEEEMDAENNEAIEALFGAGGSDLLTDDLMKDFIINDEDIKDEVDPIVDACDDQIHTHEREDSEILCPEDEEAKLSDILNSDLDLDTIMKNLPSEEEDNTLDSTSSKSDLSKSLVVESSSHSQSPVKPSQPPTVPLIQQQPLVVQQQLSLSSQNFELAKTRILSSSSSYTEGISNVPAVVEVASKGPWQHHADTSVVNTVPPTQSLSLEEDEALGAKATKAPVLYMNVNKPNLKNDIPLPADRERHIKRTWKNLDSEQRKIYAQKARENRKEYLKTKQSRSGRMNSTSYITTIHEPFASHGPPLPSPIPQSVAVSFDKAQSKDQVKNISSLHNECISNSNHSVNCNSVTPPVSSDSDCPSLLTVNKVTSNMSSGSEPSLTIVTSNSSAPSKITDVDQHIRVLTPLEIMKTLPVLHHQDFSISSSTHTLEKLTTKDDIPDCSLLHTDSKFSPNHNNNNNKLSYDASAQLDCSENSHIFTVASLKKDTADIFNSVAIENISQSPQTTVPSKTNSESSPSPKLCEIGKDEKFLTTEQQRALKLIENKDRSAASDKSLHRSSAPLMHSQERSVHTGTQLSPRIVNHPAYFGHQKFSVQQNISNDHIQEYKSASSYSQKPDGILCSSSGVATVRGNNEASELCCSNQISKPPEQFADSIGNAASSNLYSQVQMPQNQFFNMPRQQPYSTESFFNQQKQHSTNSFQQAVVPCQPQNFHHNPAVTVPSSQQLTSQLSVPVIDSANHSLSQNKFVSDVNNLRRENILRGHFQNSGDSNANLIRVASNVSYGTTANSGMSQMAVNVHNLPVTSHSETKIHEIYSGLQSQQQAESLSEREKTAKPENSNKNITSELSTTISECFSQRNKYNISSETDKRNIAQIKGEIKNLLNSTEGSIENNPALPIDVVKQGFHDERKVTTELNETKENYCQSRDKLESFPEQPTTNVSTFTQQLDRRFLMQRSQQGLMSPPVIQSSSLSVISPRHIGPASDHPQAIGGVHQRMLAPVSQQVVCQLSSPVSSLPPPPYPGPPQQYHRSQVLPFEGVLVRGPVTGCHSPPIHLSGTGPSRMPLHPSQMGVGPSVIGGHRVMVPYQQPHHLHNAVGLPHRRPLLLQEQPLLIEDLLEQEKQEQQKMATHHCIEGDSEESEKLKGSIISGAHRPEVLMPSQSVAGHMLGMRPSYQRNIGAMFPAGPPVASPTLSRPTRPISSGDPGLHPALLQAGSRPTPPPIQPGPVTIRTLPPPPAPPDNPQNEAERQQQLAYEQWLVQQKNIIDSQQKHYEAEVAKLRKQRKSLNSRQRTMKKNGQELSDHDAAELDRIQREIATIQRHLDQCRKSSRQHSMTIAEYNNKKGQRQNQHLLTSAVSQSPIISGGTNSPLHAPNSTSSSPMHTSTPQSPLMMSPSPSSSHPGIGGLSPMIPSPHTPIASPSSLPQHSPHGIHTDHMVGPFSPQARMPSPSGPNYPLPIGHHPMMAPQGMRVRMGGHSPGAPIGPPGGHVSPHVMVVRQSYPQAVPSGQTSPMMIRPQFPQGVVPLRRPSGSGQVASPGSSGPSPNSVGSSASPVPSVMSVRRSPIHVTPVSMASPQMRPHSIENPGTPVTPWGDQVTSPHAIGSPHTSISSNAHHVFHGNSPLHAVHTSTPSKLELHGGGSGSHMNVIPCEPFIISHFGIYKCGLKGGKFVKNRWGYVNFGLKGGYPDESSEETSKNNTQSCENHALVTGNDHAESFSIQACAVSSQNIGASVGSATSSGLDCIQNSNFADIIGETPTLAAPYVAISSAVSSLSQNTFRTNDAGLSNLAKSPNKVLVPEPAKSEIPPSSRHQAVIGIPGGGAILSQADIYKSHAVNVAPGIRLPAPIFSNYPSVVNSAHTVTVNSNVSVTDTEVALSTTASSCSTACDNNVFTMPGSLTPSSLVVCEVAALSSIASVSSQVCSISHYAANSSGISTLSVPTASTLTTSTLGKPRVSLPPQQITPISNCQTASIHSASATTMPLDNETSHTINMSAQSTASDNYCESVRSVVELPASTLSSGTLHLIHSGVPVQQSLVSGTLKRAIVNPNYSSHIFQQPQGISTATSLQQPVQITQQQALHIASSNQQGSGPRTLQVIHSGQPQFVQGTTAVFHHHPGGQVVVQGVQPSGVSVAANSGGTTLSHSGGVRMIGQQVLMRGNGMMMKSQTSAVKMMMIHGGGQKTPPPSVSKPMTPLMPPPGSTSAYSSSVSHNSPAPSPVIISGSVSPHSPLVRGQSPLPGRGNSPGENFSNSTSTPPLTMASQGVIIRKDGEDKQLNTDSFNSSNSVQVSNLLRESESHSEDLSTVSQSGENVLLKLLQNVGCASPTQSSGHFVLVRSSPGVAHPSSAALTHLSALPSCSSQIAVAQSPLTVQSPKGPGGVLVHHFPNSHLVQQSGVVLGQRPVLGTGASHSSAIDSAGHSVISAGASQVTVVKSQLPNKQDGVPVNQPSYRQLVEEKAPPNAQITKISGQQVLSHSSDEKYSAGLVTVSSGVSVILNAGSTVSRVPLSDQLSESKKNLIISPSLNLDELHSDVSTSVKTEMRVYIPDSSLGSGPSTGEASTPELSTPTDNTDTADLEEVKRAKKRAHQQARRKSQSKDVKTTQIPAKRARQGSSSRIEDDYDAFIENAMQQLRTLPPLAITEPYLGKNINLCKIFGSSDVPETKEPYNFCKGLLVGEEGSAVVRDSIDYYNTQPFGKLSPKVLPLKTPSVKHDFYNLVFPPPKIGQPLEDLLSDTGDSIKGFQREADSPDSILSSSSVEQFLLDSPPPFRGLEEPEDSREQSFSPPIPLLLSPSYLSVPCKKEAFFEDKENIVPYDEFAVIGLKNRVGKTPSLPLEDFGKATITLALTPQAYEDVSHVLRSLANLLNIPPPLVYDIVDKSKDVAVVPKLFHHSVSRGGLKMSRKVELQSILNGQVKFCRNCDTIIIGNHISKKTSEIPINNSNGELKLDNFSFCSKECYINYAKAFNLSEKNKNSNQGNSWIPFLKSHISLNGNRSDVTFANSSNLNERPKNRGLEELLKISSDIKRGHNFKMEQHSVEKLAHRYYYKYWMPDSLILPEQYEKPTDKEMTDLLFRMGITYRCTGLPEDSRRCTLCHLYGDYKADGPSRLLNCDVDRWVHLNCALWAEDVYETLSGSLMNVDTAIKKALGLLCYHCQTAGASIKCFKVRCTKVYHLNCAVKEGCTFYKNKTIYCAEHNNKGEKDNELSTLAVYRRVYIERDEDRQIASVMHNCDSNNLIRIGSFILISIGQLLPHQLQAFHTPYCIYPIGFKIIRFYWSTRKLHKRCAYECSIAEIDGQPEFTIVIKEEGYEDITLKSRSPKGVWNKILEPIAEMRQSADAIHIFTQYISGEDLFGLTEPAIVRILESMPGIDTLDDYNFRFGRNPLFELPLAINPSGSARSEPFNRNQLKRYSALRTSAGSVRTAGNLRTAATIASITMAYDPFITYSKQCNISRSSQYKKMCNEWRSIVYLARSKIQGLGLYAAKDIEKNTMIIEYIGEIIRSELAEIREKRYEMQNRGVYMFRLDDQRVCDATMTGGLARYVNHSCDPNCYTEIVELEKDLKIVIISNRKIIVGEELAYDYKFDEEEDSKIPCLCGAGNCRKWMN